VNLKDLAESRIVVDADICSGKPRIKGTRVTVADILLAYAEGMSELEMLRNFRSIRREDIQAAIAYSYCLADGVKLKIKSAIGDAQLFENDPRRQEEITREQQELFAKALAEEAKGQEEFTSDFVAKVKEEKEAKAEPKAAAPEKRDYDLEIEIPDFDTTRIFKASEPYEQGLTMDVNNYIFQLREDGQKWLSYSIKDGVELDLSMKRSIKLHYFDNGEALEAIFDGYLTTDRLHKVFMQKNSEGESGGRVL